MLRAMPQGSGSRQATFSSTESLRVSWASLAAGGEGQTAGLIVLYAPYHSRLPPAYLLRGETLVIGRDEKADICIPSRAVSRQHAQISKRGDRWVLTDLGGRNGTIVNGELVQEAVLARNDEIHIGDILLKLVESGADQYLNHRIDDEPRAGDRIIGGFQIQRLAAAIGAIATSDLSVLILGESGTGKEVFAEELHVRSGRRGPFKAVNCAAIPATLIEAELFGYCRGAFSGADRDRPGLIRAAQGGTLFLDEIGDMPPEAQVKLLRVLQSKEVLPVGAVQPERVDVRVVCATHRDLQKLQQSESFRGDLFARLNEYSVTLPPLRERKEDLFSLCRALAARHGRPEVVVTFPFMTGLIRYDFPFNIRELEALIKRWAAISRSPELNAEHLTDAIKERMKSYGQPRAPRPAEDAQGAPEARVVTAPPSPSEGPSVAPAPKPRLEGKTPSEPALRALLAEHRGNVAAVARLFGKDRVQVHRWMRRYGIDVNEYRSEDGGS
jgi:transcriptional regulator with GAF, ATPase, and Fis domain